MSWIINKRNPLLSCAILLAIALFGCGSGSHGATASRTGQIRIHIVWPARATNAGKYIPTYASSLLLKISPKSDPAQTFTLIVNRASDSATTEDVTFSQQLSTDLYELTAVAHSLQEGQGATVASGTTEVNVQPGINTVPLTLTSTIKKLQIIGQPISVGIGSNVTLQSGAFDADGVWLLLPDGAPAWSIVSGNQFGTITPAGTLTATSAGTIKVHAAEPVTGVYAETEVTVSTQASTIGLAQSGYPKPGADVGSTGLVAGAGSTGVIAWTFDLGSAGVGTPILGNNNLIFAVSDNGIAYALDATTGTMRWQMTLPKIVGAIKIASLVVSDDNTLFVGYRSNYDGRIQAYDATTGLPKWTAESTYVDANMTLAGGKLYVPTDKQGLLVKDARSGTTVVNPGQGPVVYPGIDTVYDPVIANGVIYYVTAGLQRHRDLGGVNSPQFAFSVYAITLASGATLWKKNVNIPAGGSYAGSYPVVTADGTVYIGMGDGNLQMIDAQTGTPKATQSAFTTPGSLQPAIGLDKSVYFTRRNLAKNVLETVRYTAGLGQELWSSPYVLNEPTVGADGTVYGAGNDLDANGKQTGMTSLYALNGADGTKKWKVALNLGQQAVPLAYGQVTGYAAVSTSGMVYVVSTDHLLYAIK